MTLFRVFHDQGWRQQRVAERHDILGFSAQVEQYTVDVLATLRQVQKHHGYMDIPLGHLFARYK
jgi:hypothetical protein